MQQIAMLGTSADPPTCGHQALLNGLLSLYPQVATWASDNPQKQHGAPLALRAQLLQALVEEINDPRLQQDQTLSHPFTIRTIERATARWPGADEASPPHAPLPGGRTGSIGGWRLQPGARLAE